MKLAFSTLGCPDFDWSDIYSMAKDLGFQGIEMRGLGDRIFSVKAKPFCPENIEETIRQLKKRHLEIPCLSSGCALKYADKTGAEFTMVLGDNELETGKARLKNMASGSETEVRLENLADELLSAIHSSALDNLADSILKQ